MAKVSPYHSKKEGTEVYHDESACTVGNNIESYNKEACSTRDGHRRCATCADISK
jgi:hypothetical protein